MGILVTLILLETSLPEINSAQSAVYPSVEDMK